MMRSTRFVLAGAVASTLCCALVAHAAPKKPLDHDAYDVWKSIEAERLSRDGRWVFYTLTLFDGDPEARIRRAGDPTEHIIERGAGGAFTFDNAFAAVLVNPAQADVKQAKKDKKKKEEMPKDSLVLIDLASGDRVSVENVKSWAVPEEGPSYVAVHLHKAPEPKDEEKDEAAAEEKPAEPQTEPAPEPAPEPEVKPEEPAEEKADEKKDDDDKKKRETGTTLVLRAFGSDAAAEFPEVESYKISKDGRHVAYTRVNKDGLETDGVYLVSVSRTEAGTLVFEEKQVLAGVSDVKQLTFSEDGDRLAFVSNLAEYQEKQSASDLYLWSAGQDAAALLVNAEHKALPRNWWVSENRAPEFSKSGARLFFGAAPRPDPEDDDETLDEDKPVLDVWSWTDEVLMTQQLFEAEQEKKRSYLAVAHLDSNRVAMLGRTDIPDVTFDEDVDSKYVLGSSDLPYRRMNQWDVQVYADGYLIDVETGEAKQVLERVRAGGFGPSFRLSPGANFIYWFDLEQGHWFAFNIANGDIVNLSERIPFPVTDELHDTPDYAGPHGLAGWTEDDKAVLIYDRFDVWAVDPTGFWGPRNVTDGVGREEHTRLRVMDLDPDEDAIDADQSLLLSAFNEDNKDAGFFRDTVLGDDEPERLFMMAKDYGRPVKAKDADVLMLTRSDFVEFPDLHVTDMNVKNWGRISDANPQQTDYRWGTAELVEWTSTDGQTLQGILYRPDGFDPSKKYPLMTYFYERMSDGLHNYSMPAPGRSSIAFSFYVSRGYVVFIPDIPYKIGYPGDSAMNAVIPGILNLVEQGFIDRDRIGVQGHSWGGYQIAYMVTQTDLFACAEAGAPVSNMTSAYGGIRWGSGLSRQFQYEKSQSRIGATLWDAQQKYIENSPIFWADRVNTPLLMMHNDNDGAVPWYQGIEYFVALRRLNKPVWMLNYNGEPHWAMTKPNRLDFAKRMQQFFDHYLMDAPAPTWMVNGVPATQKGETLGYEPAAASIDN